MKNSFSNGHAYAAVVTEDGSVIAWGDQEYGGDAGQKLVGVKNVIFYYFEIQIERIFKFFHKR